jgi:SAM-dependent methyltransferase
MPLPLLQRLHRWRLSPRASPPVRGDDIASADAVRAACTVPRLRAEPWYVDSVTIDGTRVSVAGWSMPVDDRAPAEGWFTINGRAFDRIAYPLPRDDVGAVFWQREGSALCGFHCEIDDVADPYPMGMMEIRRVVASTPRIERGRDSWFIPDPARHASLPDEDRRFRVIGDRDARGFLVSGATDYQRIDRVIVDVAGRHLHEFAHVLDWGVGCGRIARHFPAAHAQALTGCDIDRDNVDWCAANLPGTFAASRLLPPLPFEDASFDAVYGVSVFTHMREPMQLAWLAELARVMRPGGFLVTTTHGETAIEFSRLPPPDYRQMRERVAREGLVVTGNNTQLDGHADHEGEYVNVYHSIDYVQRTWSRHFDVLHIVPGLILHHDLVVMRKP